MGRSGKRTRRGKHFSEPIPPSNIKENQCFGVVTKYHGGHMRNMDLTVCHEGVIKEIKATLRGALRHFKCRQQISVGRFCLVEDANVVVLVIKDINLGMIPDDIRHQLSKVAQTQADRSATMSDDIDYVSDEDDFNGMYSSRLSDSDDDDVTFGTAAPATLQPQVDDIDAI